MRLQKIFFDYKHEDNNELSGCDIIFAKILGAKRMCSGSALRSSGRGRNLSSFYIIKGPWAGALECRLCPAFQKAHGWPVRGQSQPASALLSISGSAETSPLDVQDMYLQSLKALGIDPLAHDIRFVEDDWESPTLGAFRAGMGSSGWNGNGGDPVHVFSTGRGSIELHPISVELTTGWSGSPCIFRALTMYMT